MHREPDDEGRALVGFALDRQRAPMALGDDVVAEREPEPRPAARRLRRKEGLEDLLTDFLGDAWSVVQDPDLYLFFNPTRRDTNHRGVRLVLWRDEQRAGLPVADQGRGEVQGFQLGDRLRAPSQRLLLPLTTSKTNRASFNCRRGLLLGSRAETDSKPRRKYLGQCADVHDMIRCQGLDCWNLLSAVP